jgi:hypothetical protein
MKNMKAEEEKKKRIRKGECYAVYVHNIYRDSFSAFAWSYNPDVQPSLATHP